MPKEYIIGTAPIPAWCADKLMPYFKADGGTGWELHGGRRTYELEQGDVLSLNNQGGIVITDAKRYREASAK